jgi:phospholipid/cholesterol/gamma-HCH transport system permease protein
MRSFFCALGEFATYTVRVLARLFTGGYGVRALTIQMHRIGVESLTVVNLCAFFIGLVMVLQTISMLSRFGAEMELSGIISLSFVREIGPVFAAVMFAGRVGTGITAEIGSMVVTEQIDAYRVFGADPLAKLAAPRVAATTLMLPALTVVAVVIGIFSGYVVTLSGASASGILYLQKALESLGPLDVVGCVVKGAAFGLLIGLIATHSGFRTPRATEAVGTAATQTMVQGVLGVLIADVVLTKTFMLLEG